MASAEVAAQALPVENREGEQPELVGESKVAGSQEETHGGLEQSMAGLSVTPENELHRACAAGKLDEVRSILSKSLEGLEMLDMATGCTPIVLAIRQNHADVVRELLSAGAIVPPPGLTNDPLMLSILYPHQGQMYSMPSFMGAGSPPDFYPPPFFPSHGGGGGRPHGGGFSRKESPTGQTGNGQGNLPPADVAKAIPCRNFPNCKYGPSCVFYHPTPQHGFYPGPPTTNGFMPNGYDYSFQSPPMPPIPASFYPPGPPSFMPSSQHDQDNVTSATNDNTHHTQHQQQPSVTSPASELPSSHITVSHDTNTTPPPHANGPQIPNGHTLQGHMQPFVPSFHPSSPPAFGASPLSPPPQAFAMPPMSPNHSMMSNSMPSLPPQDQFFATSPPPHGGMQFVPNGHIRRQSFNQPGYPGKPFGHSKKLSFSGPNGAPRPFGSRGAPPGSLGTWKDGMPPPCAFFSQGKCRNGDLCKFPHLDAEGNDCRHPDVIRGIIPPLPSLGKQNRSMRMPGFPQNFGPYDPNFRQQQHQAFMAGRPNVTTLPTEEGAEGGVENGASSSLDTSSAPTRTTSHDTSPGEMASSMSSVIPPKPEDATSTAAGTGLAPSPAIARSASQPGQPRAPPPGQSRSQSPAPSNVSFHGNGHPRRGAGPRPPFNPHAAHANGGFPGKPNRSASAEAKVTQRVPQAHEFPALGGQSSSHPASPQGATGKTAAQVLSAPAPFRPVAPKAALTPEAETEESNEADKVEDNGITMDSESESDVVVITSHPPKAEASTTAQPSPSKRPGVSFASIAGSASADGAAIGVKA